MTTLNKILVLLKSQKKTQKELMDYLGLGKTAFTGWKNGSNRSYFKHIKEIAEFLNVSTDYLLGTEPESSANDSAPDYTYALFHGDGEITPGMQKEVDAYVAIAKKQLASEAKKKKNVPFYERPEFSGDEEFIKKYSVNRDAALKYGLFGYDADDVSPQILNDVRQFADYLIKKQENDNND